MADDDSRDAESYRLLQAEALAELFRRAWQREARDVDELHGWAASADLPSPIDPFSILSAEHIERWKQQTGR